MVRKSKRELERALADLDSLNDVPTLKDLWIQSLKRKAGTVEDPLSDDEFNELWNRAWQHYQEHGDG